MEDNYDIIIVGSGMVGATLAIALEQTSLKIAIIDAHLSDADTQPAYNDRGIALAEGSKRIFQKLNLWPEIESFSEPIKKIHISEKGGFGFSHLDAAEQHTNALGHVVTAPDLGKALISRLKQCSNTTLIAPATIKTVSRAENSVQITTEDNLILTTKLLVAADGANSFIRNALDFPTNEWEYNQSAVVANITASEKHNNIAYERFTQDGPVALLPMTDNRCALVWTNTPEQAEDLMQLDDDEFMKAFQKKFGWRMGQFIKVGKRLSYPLTHKRCTDAIKPRVVVIGNAAHTLHPIAGQGFNLGLRDVIALSNTLTEAASNNQDIGDLNVLNQYAELRNADQRNVSIATDSLTRLFTNPLSSVKLVRNIGMLALDAIPIAKNKITLAAMGLSNNAIKQTKVKHHV